MSGRSEGQSTVELALALPIVCVLVLAVLQVGLLVQAQILVVHAAREGARAAAVSADPNAVTDAVFGSTGLDRSRVEVRRSARGGAGSVVAVTVTYRVPGDVPLVGPLAAGRRLESRVVMRVE